jgi:hypothetical protein
LATCCWRRNQSPASASRRKARPTPPTPTSSCGKCATLCPTRSANAWRRSRRCTAQRPCPPKTSPRTSPQLTR